MDTVHIHQRDFHIYLHETRLQERITELAAQISQDLSGQAPLFVAVLNGSFMFAADLMKRMQFPCEIQFVKVQSYAGMQSTGKVQEVIGLGVPIEGRHVVVIEDIIDSGLTMDSLKKQLEVARPASLRICSLLVKPKALKVSIEIAYTGFEVENQFLVGYGLDFDGYGRNLPHIYQATD